MLISVVIGILIGIIVYYTLFYKMPLYHGPNSNDIIKNRYYIDGNTYKLKPVIYKCP